MAFSSIAVMLMLDPRGRCQAQSRSQSVSSAHRTPMMPTPRTASTRPVAYAVTRACVAVI